MAPSLNVSNVECVRYLLREMHFRFVLTRKLSSDANESFFGWLRRSAGSNDQTDSRAVLCGTEKSLKTGIASTSTNSNVMDTEDSTCSSLRRQLSVSTTPEPSKKFPKEATVALFNHSTRRKETFRSPECAALAMVGGYLSRAVKLLMSGCLAKNASVC